MLLITTPQLKSFVSQVWDFPGTQETIWDNFTDVYFFNSSSKCFTTGVIRPRKQLEGPKFLFNNSTKAKINKDLDL